jgi:hypothetical protein
MDSESGRCGISLTGSPSSPPPPSEESSPLVELSLLVASSSSSLDASLSCGVRLLLRTCCSCCCCCCCSRCCCSRCCCSRRSGRQKLRPCCCCVVEAGRWEESEDSVMRCRGLDTSRMTQSSESESKHDGFPGVMTPTVLSPRRRNKTITVSSYRQSYQCFGLSGSGWDPNSIRSVDLDPD